jgi:hypothetical protein
MRRLFWCSVAVAVAAAGSVYLASKSVEESPALLVGQALVNAAGEHSSSGGGMTVAGEPVGLPEPPSAVEVPATPVEETPAPSEVVAVADPSTPGHIFIDEEPVTTGSPVLLQANVVQAPQSPAPSLMPYCSEDEDGCPRQMPHAEEEECERPQPQTAKEAEAWELLRKAAREAAEEMPAAEQEPEEQDRCPDNTPQATPGHDHEMICPYTGQSYPRYPICPAAPEAPAQDTPKKTNNEKKVPTLRESRKMSSPELDAQGPERIWPTFRLDTMEFRPSDAGFQPILPRPF